MPTADGRTFSDVSLGFVTFTVEGRTVHLEPIQQTGGTLGFLFRDQTSRSTTYGAGIELIVPRENLEMSERMGVIFPS